MKNIKRKITLSVLSVALLVGCTVAPFGGRELRADAASQLPADYVRLSDDSATFAYQTLPEAYQNVYTYKNVTEKSYVQGAMVFSAFNSDSSTGVDVSMTFSTVVSAAQLTQSFNLLEYLVITDELGEKSDSKGDAPVFESISLTLSSKSNPASFIKISNVPSRWHNYASNIRASAPDMSAAGMSKDNSFYDSSGLLSGSGVKGSLSGCYRVDAEKVSDIYSVSYKFDTPSMTAYAYPSSHNNKDILVRDMDNPAHMIGLDEVFAGFDGDELQASLSIDGLKGKAQIAVLSFNGAKLYGDSAEEIVDVNEPKVYATNYTDGVAAEVGVSFPVFDFAAYDDVDGLTAIDGYKVYANYGKASQREVPVTDGVFIPTEAGEYTVVAERKDSSGNVGTAVYTVEALNKLAPFKLALLGDVQTQGTVGEYVALPQAVVSGGTVGVDYTLSVWQGEEQISLDKWNGLTLQSQGLYTVKYTVFDYRKVPYDFEYYIEAKLSETPIVTFPNMPKYVAVGSTLKLPEFSAVDWYSYAGIPRDAVVTASVQREGEAAQSVGAEYLVEQAGSFVYTITAKSVMGNRSVSQSYSIQAVKTELVSDYFIRENVEMEGTEDIVFTAKGNGARLAFINALPVNSYALKFNVPQEYKQFEKISVIFSDRDNVNERVTVDCSNGYVGLCGQSVRVNSTFGGSDFALAFKGNALRNSADVVGEITAYDDGSEFVGFSSGCVYVEMVFFGVTGKAGVQIKTLGNHSYFEKDATDISAPIVHISAEIPSIFKIGDVVRIPEITAHDVFDGERAVKVQVSKDKKAVPMQDNTFVVDGFGTYVLRIETTDATGHKTVINKNLYCHNYTGPVITVQDRVATTGAVGEKVQLASAKAVDYFGNEVKVRVFVLKAGGAYVMVDENNQFTPNERTDYVVWYTATDSEFNTSILKFVVKV